MADVHVGTRKQWERTRRAKKNWMIIIISPLDSRLENASVKLESLHSERNKLNRSLNCESSVYRRETEISRKNEGRGKSGEREKSERIEIVAVVERGD